MTKSEIKKVIYSGSNEQVLSLKLNKSKLSNIPSSVRAEYFKRLQSLRKL